MKTGDAVIWGGIRFYILAEYDDEFVYIDIAPDGAQLVHKSELKLCDD
jgi:hypothetical protein